MINIDLNKCIKCMKCVAACPFSALVEKYGEPQLSSEKACIKCLHCGIVCPNEAISYDSEASAIPGELPTTGENFTQELKNHILTRRSYRHFSEEPVPEEIIKEALELAAWAPSAKNQHPTKWIVIRSKEIMNNMMNEILRYVEETGVSAEIVTEMKKGNNVVMGNASALILAYAADYKISPETDTAIAMATAELYLQSKGIGTCWAGYLKRMANNIPKIREMLPQLPKECSFYGAFMLGYPQGEKYIHVPNRIKKADISWL